MAIQEERKWLSRTTANGTMVRLKSISSMQGQRVLRGDSSSPKSEIIDAAYDEYCARLTRDCQVDIDSFLAEYPGFESSIRRQIEVHHVLISHLGHAAFAPRESWPALEDEFLDFTIIEQIGAGGLSRVYLCHQVTMGYRPVVLKVASNTTFEASILGRVEHPHIVPIHSVHFDEVTGLSAICMPYLGRTTFVDVIDAAFQAGHRPTSFQPVLEMLDKAGRSGKLDAIPRHHFPATSGVGYEYVIVQMMANLADALQYAHDKGIVHGDLKPSNILLTSDGCPRLLDFNLSGDRLNCKTILGGTLPYMAPEQLKAFFLSESVNHLTEKTDVFSFGVVLYELLSGKRPFESDIDSASEDSVQGALNAISAGAVPLIRINPQLDASLDRLVQSCLALEPGDRPASMEEVAHQLRTLLTIRHRLARGCARHRSALLSASAVVLVCLAGVLYHLSQLEPYSVRQYQRAWQYYQEGNVLAATFHADKAIQHAPQFGDALYLRGRLQLQRKEYRDAIIDFEQAAKLLGDGRANACLGYAFQRLRDLQRAEYHYQQARALGYETPELLNNLGVTQTNLGKLEAAANSLSRAIAGDSIPPICLLNQAIVELRQVQRDQAFDPSRGIANIKTYLKHFPEVAEAHVIAAYLKGYAAEHDPSLATEVLEHLQAAHKCGRVIAEEELRRDPAFRYVLNSLGNLPATQSNSGNPAQPLQIDHLVDPAPES